MWAASFMPFIQLVFDKEFGNCKDGASEVDIVLVDPIVRVSVKHRR